MSLAPVILPFTHWPVAYAEVFEPKQAEVPEPTDETPSADLLKALAHLPSDIVLTCATVFSRGVILGLASGAIEILEWDDGFSLTPLSTTAGHRQSPVVALRRIAAKDTDGLSELLISAAENGEIMKHSLPSGRVLTSTSVPFRPNGIVPIDVYVIIYGKSTEIRILHQATLEPHIIMEGLLPTWPIPFPLFAERMVTLNSSGHGEHWKIWPDEARVERITALGAPVSLFKPPDKPRRRSLTRRISKLTMHDSSAVNLGDHSYGSVIAVHNVGDIMWLVLQTSGWCLYKWEEDSFALVRDHKLPDIAGASCSDAVDDQHRNWFGVWTNTGEITFVVIDKALGKTNCIINNLPASKKPNNVNTLTMSFSYTTKHRPHKDILLTPWAVDLKDIVVEFFFSDGEIRYRIGDLRTFTWNEKSYSIHHQHHFFQLKSPAKSFAPPTPPATDRMEGQLLTEVKPPYESSGSPPGGLPYASVSSLSTCLNAAPELSPTSGPCDSSTVFNGMLAIGCGIYVNFYSLTRYLLAFESPERTIEIPETSCKVSLLSSVLTCNGVEFLLIGTSSGNVYLVDSRNWKLSHRIALSGSPVLYSLPLTGRSNPYIRDIVVVASRDGTVCLVNLRKLKNVFTVPGHYAQIRLMATPKDSNMLVILYEDYCGRLCNLRNGKIENQNEINIENEEEWEISFMKLRPTIPEDKLMYTDARYAINGSSTVFVNVCMLLQDINRTTASFTIKEPRNGLSEIPPSITTAKAIVSALYSWQVFESLDEDDGIDLSSDLVDNKKMIELLFLRKFSSMPNSGEGAITSLTSIPATLGSRGIGNTLTVFHAHQDILQVSGEITSVVYLICVALARVLLTAQLAQDQSDSDLRLEKAVEAYLHRFTAVLFNVSEKVKGQLYKRPWLRGFARFWGTENSDIRIAARDCLAARIKQLDDRPKELSLTISRWRILLPGVVPPENNNRHRSLSRRRTLTGSGSPTQERRLSFQKLERVMTGNTDDLAGVDEVIDESSPTIFSQMGDNLRDAMGGFQGDNCFGRLTDSAIQSVVILSSIAIANAKYVSHVTHREIATAVEYLLHRQDANNSGGPAYDSKETKDVQNIAIEFVGEGWTIWGDDKFFSTDSTISRLIDFFAADPTPLSSKKTTNMSNDPSSAISDENRTVLSNDDIYRHEILVASVLSIATHSINRLIEICAEIIAKAADAQTRIGAVRLIYYAVRRNPELFIDRLFPLVDAMVAALDPAVTAIRNKIVSSITSLFNILVLTFPVIASHRAQQRLALALQPDVVLVYDLRSGTQMAVLEGARNQCLEIQFSPEGRHVLGIDRVSKEVYVWKLGHSLLSLIQSIGGNNTSHSAFYQHHEHRYIEYAGTSGSSPGRDLVFPRFVGKLKEPFQFSDLQKDNKGITVNWKQEKVVEVLVDGSSHIFDFVNT
ncbi:uncharacterized protein V1518DRAFT_440790 [Limtongia smithiae]|uniref:uncharacterized protein n=1 Tax=Limtongia smithiae TaxID=1125753 RepID=UPI0034CDB391